MLKNAPSKSSSDHDILKSYADRNDFRARIPRHFYIRAFLHHLPANLVNSTSLMTVCLGSGSISLGLHVHSDISLRDLAASSSCTCISPKHAVIYHDQLSNSFELLNYSEFGTLVDNCVYGLNTDDGDDSDDFWSTRDDSEPAVGTDKQCRCRDEFGVDTRRRRRRSRYIEGPAVLRHGSLVQIGCVRFLFVLVHERVKSKKRPVDDFAVVTVKESSKRPRNEFPKSNTPPNGSLNHHRTLVSQLIGDSNKAALL